MNNPTLNELKTAWLAAKSSASAANAERLAIEEAMLALLPAKVEGTVTDKETGISATYKLTRKVDVGELRAAWVHLSPNAQKAFTWKADIDTRQLRAIQELDEPTYQSISTFITSTPAKPAISIKEST